MKALELWQNVHTPKPVSSSISNKNNAQVAEEGNEAKKVSEDASEDESEDESDANADDEADEDDDTDTDML